MPTFTYPAACRVGFDLTTQDSCPAFSDLGPNHWGFKYACYLSKKNLVKGYSGGSFGTYKTPSRAEIAKTLVLIYQEVGENITSEVLPSGAPYTDIPVKHWFGNEGWDVATAGIGFTGIKGWKGLNFVPDATLSRDRAQYWADNLEKVLNK